MIKLINLKDNLEYYDFCSKLYDDSFPKEERFNFSMTIKNENNDKYTFYTILNDNTAIGFAMIWDLDEFYYGEYLNIESKLRGKNYGSQTLTHILNLVKDKLFVIEVEPYELSDISKRRINWYKRFNLMLSEYDYNMPCINENYEISSIKMKIMTTRNIKNEEKHNYIIKKLYNRVYKPRFNQIDKWLDRIK